MRVCLEPALLLPHQTWKQTQTSFGLWQLQSVPPVVVAAFGLMVVALVFAAGFAALFVFVAAAVLAVVGVVLQYLLALQVETQVCLELA